MVKNSNKNLDVEEEEAERRRIINKFLVNDDFTFSVRDYLVIFEKE